MFEVKIAPQAAADLLEIKNYMENELQNPIAAHNTISKIIETYENLTAFQMQGFLWKNMFCFLPIISLYLRIIIQYFIELKTRL